MQEYIQDISLPGFALRTLPESLQRQKLSQQTIHFGTLTRPRPDTVHCQWTLSPGNSLITQQSQQMLGAKASIPNFLYTISSKFALEK